MSISASFVRLGDCLENQFDDLVFVFEPERYLDNDDLRTPSSSDMIDCVPTSLVGMVGDDDLVSRLELQTSQDSVDSTSSIVLECHAVRICIEKFRDRVERLLPQRHTLVLEEANRFTLQAFPQLGLVLQDGCRAGTKGAVIEECDFRVKAPMIGVLAFCRPTTHQTSLE